MRTGHPEGGAGKGYNMDFSIDLQMFADGGAGAAGASGAGASGVTPQAAAADTGVTMPDAAAYRRSGRRNELENVRYGRQEDAAKPNARQQQAPAEQDDAAEWNSLKTGKHKARFDADVQEIVQGRLKGAKENQQTLDMIKPMLAEMAKRMGKSPDDLKGIVAQYMDDDSLYEEESLRTGTAIPVLKQLKQLEAQNQQLQQQNSQFTEEAQTRAHFTKLVQQAETLKQTYPDFDLQREMQDERFVRMTAPNGGCSVEEAYHALHHREIAEQAMQYAANKAQQQVSQTVQANRARPVENGMRGNARAVDVRSDPSKLTRKDLEEIARRVNAGDRSIAF